MRWKILLAVALGLCLVASSSCAFIYRRGVRSAVFNGILEAGRVGVVEQRTAERWAIDVDELLGGKRQETP
jgi:hypothetical protein